MIFNLEHRVESRPAGLYPGRFIIKVHEHGHNRIRISYKFSRRLQLGAFFMLVCHDGGKAQCFDKEKMERDKGFKMKRPKEKKDLMP